MCTIYGIINGITKHIHKELAEYLHLKFLIVRSRAQSFLRLTSKVVLLSRSISKSFGHENYRRVSPLLIFRKTEPKMGILGSVIKIGFNSHQFTKYCVEGDKV